MTFDRDLIRGDTVANRCPSPITALLWKCALVGGGGYWEHVNVEARMPRKLITIKLLHSSGLRYRTLNPKP